MAIVPGWDSIQGSHWWGNFYFGASILALILLGVMEVISHRYSERKDELTAIEQESTKKAHDDKLAGLHVEAGRLSADAEASRAAIAAANKETALARKDAAIAEQHALEAQLALEKFKAPRRLTAEQKLSVSNRMRPFSGTTFAIATSGGEAVTFAIDIADTLRQAGWQWINWPLGGVAVKPPDGRPEMGLDVMQGIETHIFDDSLKPLAVELFEALTEVGHKNVWIVLPIARPGHEKTVIIIIGTKE